MMKLKLTKIQKRLNNTFKLPPSSILNRPTIYFLVIIAVISVFSNLQLANALTPSNTLMIVTAEKTEPESLNPNILL